MVNPLKLTEMLSKAGQMQEEVQRKLGETVVEATSGGGAVTATLNGKKELLKLHIDPAAVVGLSGGQPDVEMLEDLVVAAVNEAGRKADEAIKSSLQGMLGGLNIPGLT
jgi:DNA-binding YbaB/EbfC family protein